MSKSLVGNFTKLWGQYYTLGPMICLASKSVLKKVYRPLSETQTNFKIDNLLYD